MRNMRLSNQALTKEECEEILKCGIDGVLALSGDDGYPYALPINYFYNDGKIYFHCAKEGHKIDAVKNCSKASFCVVAKNDVVPLDYTTYFKSVIAFGNIKIMEDGPLKRKAIEDLAIRYTPDDTKENRDAMIDAYWQRLCMLEFDITELTGKQASELIK